MVTPATTAHPEVSWAQRDNELYVTVNVQDAKEPKIDLTEDKLHFQTSVAGLQGKVYEFRLEFYGKVNPEKSKQSINDRQIFLVVDKADHDKPWWPRLQKDLKKPIFLKTDFSRWRDEDEDTEDEGGMGGMPGMGGMDFSQIMSNMGGGGGGGGASDFDLKGLGGEGEGDAGDSDDEEEMPALEGEEKEAPKTDA